MIAFIYKKKTLSLIICFLVSSFCVPGFSALAAQDKLQQQHSKPSQQWLDQKYSMFIHFGLYSAYGGMYEGRPVTRGYSEQIQAFADIPRQKYEAAAAQFNPVQWDPHRVVALAKQAGMQSIVFTAKHHDGFCMYHSRHTPFNIVEATPYGRDLLGELAEACQAGGIAFGVYFSLIDWHFPLAHPMSGHNADPLTPEHYQFNLAQVEELMTRYGPISEIWFDMGSLTVDQSRGLYNLVTRLQPGCMVSGRLGNDFGDFSVMADNQIPEYHLAVPWQTPASVFKETWGYREWQERGALQPKVDEKIESLVHVVGRGGNYLLNLGPRGDGSLVEFEVDIFLEVGRWVKKNCPALYATQANPFGEIFPWGEVTKKDKTLFLFVLDNFAGQKIDLFRIRGKVQSVRMLSTNRDVPFTTGADDLGVSVETPVHFLSCCEVFEITYPNGYEILPRTVIHDSLLTAANATPHFGHASLNYYAGYKSLIASEWTFLIKEKNTEVQLLSTEKERGQNLQIDFDGQQYYVTPGAVPGPDANAAGPDAPFVRTDLATIRIDSAVIRTDSAAVVWGALYQKQGRGVFGFVEEEGRGLVEPRVAAGWEEVPGFSYGTQQTLPLNPRQSILLLQEITAREAQTVAVEIGSGNGVYILLNGNYLTAHCMPERISYQRELVLLPLQEGKNQLLVKLYNAFEDQLHYSLTPLWQWTQYRQTLPLELLPTHSVTLSTPDSATHSVTLSTPDSATHSVTLSTPDSAPHSHTHTLSVRLANPPSNVTPLRAENLQILLLPSKKTE
ncbi:MAG: alpha-L-fucosidase [Bacteroidales bacterium]